MRYEFKPEKARDEVIEWLKEQGQIANFNKVVLGISGGKDSTIAAALCCRAFGAENVHGLLLPNGIQPDIDDSIEVCNTLGIKYDTINIKPIYDAFLLQYNLCTMKHKIKSDGKGKGKGDIESLINNLGEDNTDGLTKEAMLNLAPRIRMTMMRLWAQSHHHRLCGTSNLSEITVGYCTKDGDNRSDFNPLGKLTSLEVIEIGKTMPEIPLKFVLKTPADGLSGMSDEDKLGVSYEDIHKYIRSIRTVDREVWGKVHDLEVAGLHKRGTVPVYNPPEETIRDTTSQM